MALRFPRKKVALDIVEHLDDAPSITMHDGWTILRVSNKQIVDEKAFREVMDTLARLLESPAPKQPDWSDNQELVRGALLAKIRQDAA